MDLWYKNQVLFPGMKIDDSVYIIARAVGEEVRNVDQRIKISRFYSTGGMPVCGFY